MRFPVKRISSLPFYSAPMVLRISLAKAITSPPNRHKKPWALVCVMALDGHTHLNNAPAEDNDADGLNRGKDEVGQIVDHGDRIGGGGKGGCGEYGDADRQHTPKAEKEFCAFGHSFFHSLSSIVDKRYRIS